MLSTDCYRSNPSQDRGFSLIELSIVLVVLAILLTVGVPSMLDWIRNMKIRGTAESFTNSLQIARTEAIRGNTTVFYQLTDTLTNSCAVAKEGRNWVASLCPVSSNCDQSVNRGAQRKDYKCDTAPTGMALPLILAKGSFEGNDVAQIGIANTNSTWAGALCFSGIGRVTPSASLCSGTSLNPSDTSQTVNKGVTRFRITNGDNGDCLDQGGSIRCMQIEISVAGDIRLCDPAVSDASDPRKCVYP